MPFLQFTGMRIHFPMCYKNFHEFAVRLDPSASFGLLRDRPLMEQEKQTNLLRETSDDTCGESM